jgi:hypothetical protein
MPFSRPISEAVLQLVKCVCFDSSEHSNKQKAVVEFGHTNYACRTERLYTVALSVINDARHD